MQVVRVPRELGQEVGLEAWILDRNLLLRKERQGRGGERLRLGQEHDEHDYGEG